MSYAAGFAGCQKALGRHLLVTLTAGKTDELQLHAPWCKEVHRGLTRIGTAGSHDWLAEDANAVIAQMPQRRIEVIDIKCQVMSTYVAVAWWLQNLIGRAVLEDFEVRAVAATKETYCLGYGPRMDIEVLRHPVATGIGYGRKRINVPTSQDVDKEARRLLDIRHGESDVLDAAQSRHSRGCGVIHDSAFLDPLRPDADDINAR